MFLGLDIELKDLTLEDLLSKDPFLKKATQLDRLYGLIFDTRDYYLDDRSFWHQVLVCQVLFCQVLFCQVLFCQVLFCQVLLCQVLKPSMSNPKTTSHCGFLVLGNTQKSLTHIWHQIRDKNDGENICHWNHFQFPRALSELPANWSGLTNLTGWIGWAS